MINNKDNEKDSETIRIGSRSELRTAIVFLVIK